jgi:hypothetical protein
MTAMIRLLLCATGLLLVGLVVSAPNIDFQIHSWDDLREWPQMLNKGARWIKIDPYYQPASFCTSQPRSSQDPRGCFVLIHNPPSRDVSYFTLDDVLQFLSSSEYQSYLSVRTVVSVLQRQQHSLTVLNRGRIRSTLRCVSKLIRSTPVMVLRVCAYYRFGCHVSSSPALLTGASGDELAWAHRHILRQRQSSRSDSAAERFFRPGRKVFFHPVHLLGVFSSWLVVAHRVACIRLAVV